MAKIRHIFKDNVRIRDDIIETRLETEGQQQKAALEAGEAAKAQLEAKLKKKEEEVLTLFILVIIITGALHSPCSSCPTTASPQVSAMAKQLSKSEQELASMKRKKK